MSCVLVSQLARMGDLTQSLYLLGDLAHAEGHQVSVLVDRRLGSFVRARAPWLDRVYGLDVERYLEGFRKGIRWTDLWRALADELRPLKETRFDRVINLNYGELAAAVTESIRGQAVADGFHRKGGGSLGDPWVDLVSRLLQADRRWNRFHLVDVHRFHSLRRASTQEVRTRMAEPLSDRSLVGMQIATRCPKRTWGADGFIEVARGLQRDVGCEILLLGEARERRQAEHIARRAGCGRLRDLVGKTSLEDLVQVLASCDRLLSGDTGTLHVAAYLGVPSLGIYLGPAYVFETGPYGPGHLVFQAAPPCGPCREEAPCERDACREGIRPESVLQLLKGEPVSPLPEGVGVYASGFVEGWLQYSPLHPRQATPEDVIGFLYLGSAGVYLATPPGRLPSLAGLLPFLFSRYEVSRSVLRTVCDSLERSLPVRMREADRQALLGILRRGCTQMREMLDGCVPQEPECPATAAA